MSKKILIIEDEKPIADTIVYSLKAEGFESCWYPTGNQGLYALKNNDISLIILDIGLPDINGIDLCRNIRQNHSTPIIFLTARADEIDRIVGLEIGGDDYMVKPFSPRELVARVRAVLRRCENKKTVEAPALSQKNGVFFIDEEKKSVLYNNTAVALSKQEFKILSTLIGHPGRVYSRDELMNAAWDEPGFCTDRTVDAHIKTIRAKLRAINSDADPIETRRGFGYSLKKNL